MLFALVAVSLSTSLGSITVEAHPGTRLLAQADVVVVEGERHSLVDLQHELDVELHKSSPFIVPGVLFGLAAVSAIIGTIFIFPIGLGWTALILIAGFYLAAIVLLCVAIGTVIGAGVVQANRNKRIKALREEIAALKNEQPMPESLPPPPPPGVQNLPVVTPRLVLAHF